MASDFGPVTEGRFTIAAGETQTADPLLRIPIRDEEDDQAEIEADMETFHVELELDAGAPAGVSVGPPTKFYIQENDLRLSIAGPGGALAEGAAAAFTLRREGATTPAVTVTYVVSGAGIDAGDFTHPEGTAEVDRDDDLRRGMVLPAGVTSLPLSFALTDDGAFERDETLTVTLETQVPEVGGTVVLAAGSASVDVIDDDIQVAFVSPSAVVSPVQEGASVTFPITLKGPVPDGNVEVLYSLSGPSITAGDFEPDAQGQTRLTGRVATFNTARGPDGVSALDLTVATENDGAVEAAETFTVTLLATASPGAGPELSVAPGTARPRATIAADSDDHVTIGPSSQGTRVLEVTEGEDLVFSPSPLPELSWKTRSSSPTTSPRWGVPP